MDEINKVCYDMQTNFPVEYCLVKPISWQNVRLLGRATNFVDTNYFYVSIVYIKALHISVSPILN